MADAPPAPSLAPSISPQNANPISNQQAVNEISIVHWLGAYAVVNAIGLAIGLLFTWTLLYRPAGPTVIVVNPPLITLDPLKDVRHPFTVTILPKPPSDSAASIIWSVDGGGEIDSQGVFKPLSDSSSLKVVKVTARTATNPSQTGTAIVHLIPGRHFEILPQGISLFPSQQIPFRTPNSDATWSSSTSAGSVSKDGLFTAAAGNERQAVVQVTAHGMNPDEIAATAMVITPPFETGVSNSWLGMLFVILCGSLGSMIYYAASFVNFVGNRTFRSSWFWFYISRPFVGGALALIFYFALGSGIVPGAAATDLMKVGMVSSLVGLFSDKAVKKLSDVLDVLLATKDERKDKLHDNDHAPEDPAEPASVKQAPGQAEEPSGQAEQPSGQAEQPSAQAEKDAQPRPGAKAASA